MVPVQVRRIVLITAVIVVTFLAVRSQLVPKSFGDYGHYRADSVAEIAALPVGYGGEEACTKCHAGIDEIKVRSRHRAVHCESCHGPCNEHALDPVAHPKVHPQNATELCLRCHEINPTRPPDFPQVDRREHRPGIECVACHNPHSLEEIRP
jgi:hypothetical protein